MVASDNPIIVAPQAPKVPAVIDPNDPNGLLPRSALGAPLVVTFMDFTQGVGPGESDLVELGFMPLDGAFRPVSQCFYPNDVSISFPQSLEVPRDFLTSGIYQVAIRISISEANPTESDRTRLTIDTTAPNFGQKPTAVIFPPELGGTLDETYLTTHGQVIVEVPFYADVIARDRAVYFWTDRDTPPDTEIAIREQEFSQYDIDNRTLLITVYADEIRTWGSGKRYLYYELRDLAGNTGPRSYLADINVDLSPMPGALPPPRVPLSPRGLVDRQQARDGVRVEIDRYDFPDAGHSVAIFWDGAALAEFPVDPAGFPLNATVPWPTLHAKGDGPLRAHIYYRIRQGGTLGPPSPDISVAVNLTLAGPDHANAPALVNRGLAKVEVRGQVSDIPNTLLTADYGLDAKALLRLYDNPKPGEVLEFYWGRYPGVVATYVVQAGDVSRQPLELRIPWHVIDTNKNDPLLPVYYTTSNGVNQQESLVTRVKVWIVLIEDLKEPVFPHANRWGVLDCCAKPRLWEGVTVRIKADPHFGAGDIVTLVWQGCRGENGTSPIAGTYAELQKKLVASDVGKDLDFVVADYEKLIAPMVNNGSGLVYYELQRIDGSKGKSKSDFVIINRTMPSGATCSPTNDLCETDWTND